MTATGAHTNSANHELSVSQSLRMINPSMSMNRNVAMLKKNSQPAIRFNGLGNCFTVLFRQFCEIFQQLQADLLAFLRVKLHGDNIHKFTTAGSP